MFNFCSLYSGSSGNCLFVETDKTKILIDAGVSQRKILDALASFNVDITDIDAILVTHEHSDHTKNLGVISQKYDIPVYINKKTLNNLPSQKDKIIDENRVFYTSNKSFSINDLDIYPFSIPHDAADPCGFNILHKGKKITIATDIGHIENNMININSISGINNNIHLNFNNYSSLGSNDGFLDSQLNESNNQLKAKGINFEKKD